MFVKVCGVTTAEQAAEISQLVEYIGYIFHPGSPRHVSHSLPSLKAKKVGVFVDLPLQKLIHTAIAEKLEVVQLHGSEPPEYCAALEGQVTVIKSFGIDESFNFDDLNPYTSAVDYFLFDTKTPKHGGSGKQFEWKLLAEYEGAVPFILSGGLRYDLLQEIKAVNHPMLAGIDLNSGFETAPGNKNVALLKSFIHDFKQ